MGARETTEYERLSRWFSALAVPNRLELLAQLRVPRTAGEITLTPSRADRERNPDRPLSRQAVEKHLARLVDLDLVQARPSKRDGQPVTEFVVNPARLFLVLDEVRRVTFRAALAGRATADTDTDEDADVQLPPGPQLLLVNGPLTCVPFPLAGAGPWVIGRDRDAAVALPHDPFVSLRNTEIARAHDGFTVTTLAASRNGTRVNWSTLPDGGVHRLERGDTLGVGRSVLLFRD